MIVADADIFDLIGLEVERCELIDDAHFRRDIWRGHGVAGVPQQIVVAVLDEIAAVNELELQVAIGIGVRETLVDRSGRLRRAAVLEARERHVFRRERRRCECGCARADRDCAEYPIHCCPHDCCPSLNGCAGFLSTRRGCDPRSSIRNTAAEFSRSAGLE
jgi:hypothetical protein